MEKGFHHRKCDSAAIPHYATNFFVDSKSASRACQLRSDLLPKIRRLLSPIRAIETSAKNGRGESLRETERVGHDPLRPFRETCLSGPLFDLASSFPRPRDRVDGRPVLLAIGLYHGFVGATLTQYPTTGWAGYPRWVTFESIPVNCLDANQAATRGIALS